MRESRAGDAPWLKVLMVALFAFLYLPLVVLVVLSFNDAQRAVVSWQGFTTRWYGEVFREPGAARRPRDDARSSPPPRRPSRWSSARCWPSAWSATREAACSTARSTFRCWSRTSCSASPCCRSTRSSGFRSASARSCIAHSVWGIAFAAAIIRTRLRGFDRSIEEASLDLGVREIPTFFRITLPVILPGIVVGGPGRVHAVGGRVRHRLLHGGPDGHVPDPGLLDDPVRGDARDQCRGHAPARASAWS